MLFHTSDKRKSQRRHALKVAPRLPLTDFKICHSLFLEATEEQKCTCARLVEARYWQY